QSSILALGVDPQRPHSLGSRQFNRRKPMKKYFTVAVSALLATVAVSFAGPDKAAMEAKENAAWQAYKDKKADAFQKVVDKDIKCVYEVGVADMQKELSDMKTADLKSFAI